MADEVVKIFLRAQDEATAKVRALSGELGALPALVSRIGGGLGVWGALAGGLSLAGGAAVALGGRLADQIETLDRLHASTGISISQAQVLREAFKDQGLSAEDADAAIRKMAKSLGDHDPLLKQLGISTRDVYEATLQASRAMAQTGDIGTRAAIATGLFGKSADEAIGPLTGLSASAEKAAARLRETGAAFTPEDIRRARELDEAMDQLRQSTEGLSKALLSDLAPSATRAVSGLEQLLKVFRDLREEQRKGDEERERTGRELFGLDKPQMLGAHNFPSAPPTGPTDAENRAAAELRKAFERRQHPFAGKDPLFTPPGGFGSGLDSFQQDIETMKVWLALVEETDKPLGRMIENLALASGAADQVDVKRIGSELQILNAAADSTGLALRQAFDAWAFEGQRAADAIKHAFSSAFRDIVNEAFRVGLGELLGLIGTAIGGPIGGFVGKVGGRLAGGSSAGPVRGPLALAGGPTNITNIYAFSTADAIDQYQSPGGALRQAQDRVRILRRAGQD